MRFIVRRDSFAVRVALCRVLRPFVRVESCRVGDNVRSFVAITTGA
jgi:hypothetical protein